MTSPPQQPQPGWYPDDHATGGERWWDGERWTEQRRPMATYSGPAPATDRDEPLLMSADPGAWGMFWAIVFPIVGLVYGLVLLRSRPQRAQKIIIVAVLATVVYGAMLALFR